MSSPAYSPSRSSATRKRTYQSADQEPIITPRPEPQAYWPNRRPISQFLAFGIILLLGLLQFLPATHFRDPSDPLRNWIPFHSNASSALPVGAIGASSNANSRFAMSDGGDDGMVHVVSWMDCLDLRVLAVLANSTLSSSIYPDLVFFHFFIPGGNDDKVSYFKLKVLFPHSNLEIHGQEEVKKIIRAAFSDPQYAKPRFEEIVPFIIPIIHQSISKFIYVSANLIMKGRVEELIGIDLTNYAIAAAEDCSERLNTLVNPDVLDAIQRSASKPWVLETPYAKDSCMPDLSILLINGRKLETNFLEAVLWWSKVLNLSERTTRRNPAVALALYNRYLKLSSSWLVSPEINNSAVIRYDGPKTACLKSSSDTSVQSSHGNVWIHYIPSFSDRILGS